MHLFLFLFSETDWIAELKIAVNQLFFIVLFFFLLLITENFKHVQKKQNGIINS